jgi:hypothetical protein
MIYHEVQKPQWVCFATIRYEQAISIDALIPYVYG